MVTPLVFIIFRLLWIFSIVSFWPEKKNCLTKEVYLALKVFKHQGKYTTYKFIASLCFSLQDLQYFVSRWHRGRSEHARCVIGLCIKELFIYLFIIIIFNFRKSFATLYLTNLFCSLCKYKKSWYDRKLRTPHWPLNFTEVAVLLCKIMEKRLFEGKRKRASPRYCLHIRYLIFVIIRTKDPRRSRRSRRRRGRRQLGRRRHRQRGRQGRRGRRRGRRRRRSRAT